METEKPKVENEASVEKELGTKSIIIVRTNPDNLKSVFANDFMISHLANEYYLTFSVVEPPPVYTAVDLEQVNNVPAIAVSKIVVTPKFAQAFLEVLSRNLSDLDDKPGTDDTAEKK